METTKPRSGLGALSPSRVALAIAAAYALGLTAYRAATVLPSHKVLAMSHPSGTWATLAIDLAHGELYRPLLDERGFGGARYFPLHLVLQGGLIRAGLGPMVSGHIISIAASLALLAAVFLILRREGQPRFEAGAIALLPLATLTMQVGIADIRADILPAALNLWGLVLCMPREGKSPRVRLAAMLFALAFLAKITTVSGVLAVAWVLARAGDWRKLRDLALGSFGIAAAGLAATEILSAGRFSSSVLGVASGGATWHTITGSLGLMWASLDPTDTPRLVLAGATLLALPAAARRGLVPVAFVTTLAITCFMFGSPGVAMNHLIDIEVLTILLVATQAPRLMAASGFAHGALALTALTLSLSLAQMPRFMRPVPFETLVAEAGTDEGPLLAENPWVAITAGERPVLLDAFNLRLLAARDPAVGASLLERLDHRAFRAVVLLQPLDSSGDPWGDHWYGDVHFIPGFAEHLTANYELVAEHPMAGGGMVWRRKK